MIADDDAPLDDRFLAEMAELDEALAAGNPSRHVPFRDVDPALDARRQRDLACLERLQGLRPCRQPDADPTSDLAASTVSAGIGGWVAGKRLGRFRLVRELGRGGFGVVFLAFDPTLSREVALKVPRPESLLTPDFRDRFLREAKAAAALDHPNLVTVFEAGEIGPIQYISSAYCPGPTLAQELKHRGQPVSFTAAATLLAALADGVTHAHAHGVIHRDLKPSNIMLKGAQSEERGASGNGSDLDAHSSLLNPLITDFGLSKQDGDSGDATRTGAVMGTPCYMAPEQARGKWGTIGPAVDVYALGAIGYELLTGRPPFRGESDIDTLQQACSADPVAPQLLRPKVPRDLTTICLKCLEKDPARRYASAALLAADLQRYLADEPVHACPPSAWYQGRKFARRNRLALGVTAAVVLAALGAATVLAVSNAVIDRKQRETERALAAETASREDLQRAVDRERRNYYGHAFELARRDWLTGDVEQARRQLQNCPAELRDRDWEYLHRACRAELHRLEPAIGTATLLRYSPDGKHLATFISNAGRITVWDTVTGLERTTLPTSGQIAALAFSPDGHELIWATDGHQRSPGGVLLGPPAVRWGGFEVTVWDLVNGRRAAGFGRKNTGYVVLSPDGARAMLAVLKPNALTFEPPESVSVCDTRTGRELCTLAVPNSFLAFATFHPDGHILTVSSSEKAIRFWDGTTGQMARKVDYHNPGRFVLSPDGQRLAMVAQGTPPQVTVLDVRTFREIAVIRGHAVSPTSLAFSPDGRRLTTGGSDKVATVWDTDTGRELLTLRGHSFAVWDVAFSPDGGCLASSSRAVRIWDVNPPYAPGPDNSAVK